MITLDMPEDVRTYVLEYQGKKKASTGRGQFSQQDCIYAIIREHRDCKEKLDAQQKIIDRLQQLPGASPTN